MIISNLSKTYKNKKSQVKALKNINLSFDNNGLVFVTGKSGSGKTTLLSLIGGLLDFNEGDILINGKSIKSFSDTELENYRLNYVSFVFQDFCLLNELTVYENVNTVFTLLGKEDKGEIDEILKGLDILELKNKYPTNLSSGQKQRVAIARSLAKDSPIILCDEPTGNLDKENSKQILTILKEISKKRLVITVSHNLDDAYLYGDRVIELKNGMVNNDLSLNEEINDENYTVITNFNSLNKEQLDELNNDVKNGKIKNIVPPKYFFKPTKEVMEKEIKVEEVSSKLTFKKSFKFSKRFLKNKLNGVATCSILTSLLIGLLYVAQSFVSFDDKAAIKNVFNEKEISSLVLGKGYLDKSDKVNDNYIINITDEDETIIKDNYEGDYYKLYNYSLPCSLSSWLIQNENTITASENFSTFFAKESYGLLIATEDYIKEMFEYNQKIYFQAKLEEEKEYGIYITDYLADSIMFYREDKYKTYEDLLGEYKNDSDTTYAYINGVIKTQYDKKYSRLKKDFLDANKNNDTEKLEQLILSDEFMSAYDDLVCKYSICFSTNADFADTLDSYEARNFVTLNNSKIHFNLSNTDYHIVSDWAISGESVGVDLPDNCVSLSLSAFNAMFNTNYSFVEAKIVANKLSEDGITFKKFPVHLSSEEPLINENITIDVREDYSGRLNILLGNTLFNAAKVANFIPYSIYFKDYVQATDIIDTLFDNGFYMVSYYADAALDVANIVNAFSNFFIMILVVLCLSSLSVLIFFSYDIIKKNRYNIGVLKSMGANTKNILSIFTPHIILVGILSIIGFAISGVVLSVIGNAVITSSMVANFHNPAFRLFTIIDFIPIWVLFDIISILIISLVAMIIPIILLRKIKPIEILREE